MQSNQNEEVIRIDARSIMQKFKCKEDIINFCREIGYYFPNKVGYDSKYFMQFLKGEKKLLTIGRVGGFGFRYFNKDGLLTKDYILNYIKKDEAIKSYLPDDANYKGLDREYLLCLLANLNQDVYRELYKLYKQRLAERTYSKYDIYEVAVNATIAKQIASFKSVRENDGKGKMFRMTKNHQPTHIYDRKESSTASRFSFNMKKCKNSGSSGGTGMEEG